MSERNMFNIAFWLGALYALVLMLLLMPAPAPRVVFVYPGGKGTEEPETEQEAG